MDQNLHVALAARLLLVASGSCRCCLTPPQKEEKDTRPLPHHPKYHTPIEEAGLPVKSTIFDFPRVVLLDMRPS